MEAPTPTSGYEEKRVLRGKFRKENLRSGSAPAARGGSPHPDERVPEEKSTELAKREKNFAFYLHLNLESSDYTSRALIYFATHIGTSTNRFAPCFATILRDSSYQQLSVYV